MPKWLYFVSVLCKFNTSANISRWIQLNQRCSTLISSTSSSLEFGVLSNGNLMTSTTISMASTIGIVVWSSCHRALLPVLLMTLVFDQWSVRSVEQETTWLMNGEPKKREKTRRVETDWSICLVGEEEEGEHLCNQHHLYVHPLEHLSFSFLGQNRYQLFGNFLRFGPTLSPSVMFDE